MQPTFKVPIRNLFYLLSYANQMPSLIESFNEVEDDLINIDFLAEQLNRLGKSLVKKGLVRDYVSIREENNRIGGRVLINESMNNIMMKKPIVVCEKDSYSSDIVLNQIMKSTLTFIVKNQLVAEKIRRDSFILMKFLEDVSTIPLSRELFLKLHFTRHTHPYRPMIHLAWLLFEYQLLSHQKGSWNLFNAELTDSELEHLFEKFLLGFYQAEQNTYHVKSEVLAWQLQGNQQLLPVMRTDISMIHKTKKEKIIMDAKCYRNVFQTNMGKSTFISHNMYQLNAYLMNQPRDISARGILIYPLNGYEVNEKYYFQNGESIEFITINLDDSWDRIKNMLLTLVEERV